MADLAEGLAGWGYEVVLCGPSRPAGTSEDAAHVKLDLGRAIAPRRDLAAIAGLAKIVKELKPGIVHAHSSKAGAIARLARLARPGTPVLYSPHGYAFKGYFERERQRTAYRAIERSLAALASRVICVCEAEARAARAIGQAARVRIVHNGIAAAAEGPVDPAVAGLAKTGPVVGALTLLRPGKGIETLIDAVPGVLAGHPDAQVAIVGGGPGLEALRERARLAGVAEAVHFLGPSSDPMGVLRGMDVFVHPSWAESFPYVVLEAMSLGRAIVASDVGGIGEAIVDGESGRLVAARDPEDLGRATIALLDDAQLRRRMGDAARLR
ncbi:MAG TPA: glycosyltransferase, partial [Solirubrobacteraceae bacterium]|nr:glycosyltransferase [Solirubrobacteraceae bacterium]